MLNLKNDGWSIVKASTTMLTSLLATTRVRRRSMQMEANLSPAEDSKVKSLRDGLTPKQAYRWSRDGLSTAQRTRGVRFSTTRTIGFCVVLVAGVMFLCFWAVADNNGLQALQSGRIAQLDGRKGRSQPLTLLSHPNAEHGYDKHPYLDDEYLLHFSTVIHPRKSTVSSDYVLSSLWFIADQTSWNVFLQGQVAKRSQNISFTCNFGPWQSPGTMRIQGRNEYVTVECELPSRIAVAMSETAPDVKRRAAFQELPPVTITAWLYSGNGSTQVIAEQALTFYTPEHRAKFGVCTSTLRLSDSMTLADLLEWRVYHWLQGVQSVNWGFRNQYMFQWVERLNVELGMTDTARFTPVLVPELDHPYPYHDQMVWIADCFTRNGFINEWLGVFDVDEYLTPVGPHSDAWESNAYLEYLDGKGDDIAAVLAHESFWGGGRSPEAPTLSAFPMFPRNAHQQWDNAFIRQGTEATLSKTIYRTRAMHDIWVHGPVWWLEGFWNEDDHENLTFLHSRRKHLPGVQYSDMNVITPQHIAFWNRMAEQLQKHIGLTEMQ